LTIVLELEADTRSSQLPAFGSQQKESLTLLLEAASWKLEAARDSSLTHCMCCGRKKLPFAGYSIVKELTLKLPATSLQLPAS